MTLPTIVPAKWQGTIKDFLQTKVDRSGASRCQTSVVSVPTGTTTTTVVGITPFNRGERIVLGATKLFCAALGASVTVDIGVVYDDNTNNTNAPTLFASGLTAAAAGGELVLPVTAAKLQYVTTANGWVVATIGGATTGTTGDITAQVEFVYDGLNTAN